MSVIESKNAAGGAGGGLPRPYTHGSFRTKLLEFQELIKELTLQDVEATPEERRQMITGKRQTERERERERERRRERERERGTKLINT